MLCKLFFCLEVQSLFLREIVRIDLNVLPNIEGSQEEGASLRCSANYIYSINLQWNEACVL